MAADDTGFLDVQTGKFQKIQRISYSESLSGGRLMDISRCSVSHWSVIGDGDNERKLNGLSFDKDDEFYVQIIEMPQGVVKWPEDPETMGGVHGNHANLWLPPAIFAHFWTVAEKGGASINIVLKPGEPERLKVINVKLTENIPVAQESVRDQIMGSVKWITLAFWTFLSCGPSRQYLADPTGHEANPCN